MCTRHTYNCVDLYINIYIHMSSFDDSDWWPMTIDNPSLYMCKYKHINKYINKYINKCVQDIHTIVLINS
jgi:hypothetical protein